MPNQFRQKKTSRREALAFYREHFDIALAGELSGIPPDPSAPPSTLGVQRWISIPPTSAAAV